MFFASNSPLLGLVDIVPQFALIARRGLLWRDARRAGGRGFDPMM
jgi:hypothetical protein